MALEDQLRLTWLVLPLASFCLSIGAERLLLLGSLYLLETDRLRRYKIEIASNVRFGPVLVLTSWGFQRCQLLCHATLGSTLINRVESHLAVDGTLG